MDATNYYTVGSTDRKTIKKTPRAGGPTTTLVSAAQSTQSDVWQLMSDGANLYWLWDDPSFGSVDIRSIPISGGPITNLTSMKIVNNIAQNGSDLLWSEYSGQGVQWKSLTSNATGYTLTGPDLGASYAQAMVSDAQYLYYVESTNVSCSGNSWKSSLKRVPVHGGTPVLIDSGCGSISDLAVDSSNLYYTRGGSGSFVGLYSFPLSGIAAGGQPAKLGSGGGWTASDGTNLFYCDGRLAKRPVGGGSEVGLSDSNVMGGPCIGDVKLAGQCVVYRSYEAIMTVNKTP